MQTLHVNVDNTVTIVCVPLGTQVGTSAEC